MDNGILQVTISKPDGHVTGIQGYGIDNMLEVRNKEINRGYRDLVWSETGSTGTTGTDELIKGSSFRVIVQNEEQVEISFTRQWDFSLQGNLAPLNIEKRYIMTRNSSGFYSYGIYEHLKEWPAFNLPQTRIVFRLRKDKFQYMAVSDNRQRHMPLPDDRLPKRCEALAYPEAVVILEPIEPEFIGEVDDKYQYSYKNRNFKVHGWTSSDPPVGFWQITPSNEFRSGGPLKQNLTSHVGPITLAMFLSAHYAGEDLVLKLKQDEPWKKVFSPVFFDINTLLDNNDSLWLWEDAKQQALIESQSWPYNFPASEDFSNLDQRGSISGRLQVRDRRCRILADRTQGLSILDNNGCRWYFSITNIRAGDYNLYAFVPGFIGDYRNDDVITITEGCDIDLGDRVFEPPRDGPTLWEIGIPDRSAAEFYIPDPNPKYINKLYVNHPDRFRHDYKKDWFYAQVTRKKDDDTYEATTWQIKFNLNNVDQNGIYKLRLAVATANVAELQVRVNDPKVEPPLFTTGQIANDNTIARHGIHGLYRLYSIDLPGAKLMAGDNTIFLTSCKL
ncbi:Rhamnogalacturonate lyase family protein [Melia azedarach]|uniref:Rhamnogalacturonate lyase family protein n=1 Tax=Melia azedarach TaxID=155640 RepID=A0ACC1WR22_MELAZ|nr:Rhamnogalacturonate lyase family protein [Melia azedarach]